MRAAAASCVTATLRPDLIARQVEGISVPESVGNPVIFNYLLHKPTPSTQEVPITSLKTEDGC